jgi:hypothetical protein
MISYNNRKFKPLHSSKNGETSTDTIFHYVQEGHILSATYSGGAIVKGQLLGLVDESGTIDMRYQQVNREGNLMTGVCRSIPEVLGSGKIRLHETWQWTSGDRSKGSSVLEEI